MPFYREADVLAFLKQHGCEYEGDRFKIGMGWIAPDGMPFTLPDAIAGWMDADVVDLFWPIAGFGRARPGWSAMPIPSINDAVKLAS